MNILNFCENWCLSASVIISYQQLLNNPNTLKSESHPQQQRISNLPLPRAVSVEHVSSVSLTKRRSRSVPDLNTTSSDGSVPSLVCCTTPRAGPITHLGARAEVNARARQAPWHVKNTLKCFLRDSVAIVLFGPNFILSLLDLT